MRHILFALAALATPTLAQNTTTNCYRIGNQVNCNSQQQPMVGGTNLAPVDFGAALGPAPNPYVEQQQALQDRQAAQLRQQQIELQRMQIERLKASQGASSVAIPTGVTQDLAQAKAIRGQKVAAMIAQGRCDSAVAYLKAVNDPDMMEKAITICLITSPPK